MTDFDALIDDLAADMSPVRARSTSAGRIALAIIALLSLAGVFLAFGFRVDVMAAGPPPLLLVAAGLMLVLAVAAGASAVRMARPQVGAAPSGAPWALAGLMVLPAVAIAVVAVDPRYVSDLAIDRGIRCLALGVVSALGALAFLTYWLRRGAPVAPDCAAWLAGLSAGAIGALAVTLECPQDALAHLGVWHVAVPLVVGGAARLFLPRYLRW